MFTFESIGTSLIAVLGGLAIHIIWWTLARPKNDVPALFLCMTMLPVVGLLIRAVLVNRDDSIASVALDTLVPSYLAIAFGCAYIIIYPGAQAASPSMLILILVARRGSEGLTREELLEAIDDRSLCEATVTRLIHEKFAHCVAGRLMPGSSGALLIRICRRWRVFLGLSGGQG